MNDPTQICNLETQEMEHLVAKMQTKKDDKFPHTGKHTEKAVDFLNDLFRRAIADGIGDIHFFQTREELRIRFRVPGGILEDYARITDTHTLQIIDDKLRSRSHIAASERSTPRDGRMSLSYDGNEIDVRVNFTPGVSEGQLVVCRILNQSNASKRLDDIEMTHAAREALMGVIDEPSGLFLVTGPTGSGKTTTLYAMLNALDDGTRNIITIEEPVEYRNSHYHQINVDSRSVTFQGALRAVLRQDPDIIMVGEIRDTETAQIAVQAALSGHLVFSTLHSNTAPGAISRMITLGVDPALLSSALRGVSAQRLVRTITSESNVESFSPSDNDNLWLYAQNIHRNNPTYKKVLHPIDDYHGVTPVMEIVLADHRVKKAMYLGEAEIYEAASRQPQFETIAQAAERLAFVGRTTLQEARRTISIQEAPAISNKRLGQILVESGKISACDMEETLAAQAKMGTNGNHKRIGCMLIEQNLCSPEDVFHATGFTAEAQDILQRICTTQERKLALELLLKKWTAGRGSLFKMVIESGIVTIEELIDANSY